MDQPMKKSDLDFDYDNYGLERRLDAEQTPDTAGYWFLTAVLFAFIAAASSSTVPAMRRPRPRRTITNNPTAQTDPVASPPIVPR